MQQLLECLSYRKGLVLPQLLKGKDQDHRGRGNKLFGTDTHLFEKNLSRMLASKHLVPCFVT